MTSMARTPLLIYSRGPPTMADCELGCSASISGSSREVLNGRRSSRGSWERGCFRSRRRSIMIHHWDTNFSTFWNCEQRWRRDPHSGSWGMRCDGAQHGKWKSVTDFPRFDRRDGTLSCRIRGLSLKNTLKGEEVGEPVVWRQAGRWRRKGVGSFRLYASRDPYEILGVPSTATEKEIKQAYRKLALKLHPDVNKEPDAQQKFMQIKSAYQTLTDEKSRVKYDASKRGTSSWDPFSWESTRSSSQKQPQNEEFYGFGEFFKDVSVSIGRATTPEDFFRDLQADNHRQTSKPKSLWEELAEIGEEFVEFLEKELNVNDATANADKRSGYESSNNKKKSDPWGDAKKKSEDDAQAAAQHAEAEKVKVETEIAEIEDMLAKLKKELGK